MNEKQHQNEFLSPFDITFRILTVRKEILFVLLLSFSIPMLAFVDLLAPGTKKPKTEKVSIPGETFSDVNHLKNNRNYNKADVSARFASRNAFFVQNEFSGDIIPWNECWPLKCFYSKSNSTIDSVFALINLNSHKDPVYCAWAHLEVKKLSLHVL